jgi:hypothetical protein
MLGITTTNARVGGFRGKGIDADATTIYNRIIADGGVSNLERLNFFVKGLKAIYGSLTNVPVCYDAHWIGYKLGSGTGATAGQAAAKLYSLTVAGDAVQTTAASQPLLLAHNGASSDNYWWGSGVGGNNVITPDAAANRITGDIDIIAYIKHTSLAGNAIVSKNDNGSNRGYNLVIETNTLTFYYGTTSLNTASATVAISNGATLWIRCTRNSITGIITFFTSNDSGTTNPQSVTWTQLGATIAGITGALNSSSPNGLLIGGYVSINSGFVSNERIYKLTVSNSIGGTPVVDFNPATYNASTSQTNWTSATGEVWTISTGTATSGYKGVLVDRTIVMSDGVDDNLTNSDTTTFRTTFAAVSVNRTGAFFGGILNNNTGASALSQWMHTQESTNIIDANAVFTPTKYVNNIATSTYTPYRTFIGQIDLALTPNTANGRIIGFLGGNNYLLGNIKTILQTTNNPNATERTATFNLLKTLNNL